MSDKWYISGPLGIGTEPKSKLSVAGENSTVEIETRDIVHLLRPGVGGVKNDNSAALSVGSFETGISGATRLDIKLSGVPDPSNDWGLKPDKTIMSLQANGNVGIGTNEPKAKLEIVGGTAISDGNGYAVPNNRMASGSLTIGSTQQSYGGRQNWNDNTAGLLLETLKNTEIAVHDAGVRIASLMYYEGDADNRITIGRDMHWGPISSIVLNGNVGIGTTSLTSKLHVAGNAGVFSLEGTDHAYIQWYPHGLPAGRRAWIGFGSANVNTLTIGNESPGGRMDIFGDEALVVLNKQGVVISKAWGGNGNLSVEGSLSLGGSVGIGTPSPKAKLEVSGDTLINGILRINTGPHDDWQALALLANSPAYGIFMYVGSEIGEGDGLNFYWVDGNGNKRKARILGKTEADGW